MDAGRKFEGPGSEAKDFIIRSAAGSLHCLLSPPKCYRRGQWGAQMHAVHILRFVAELRNLKVREPQPFIKGNKSACPLPWKQTLLYRTVNQSPFAPEGDCFLSLFTVYTFLKRDSTSACTKCRRGSSLITMSSHKTFRIKWFQATKQKQNCPILQWIQMKTGNKIWYNSKRRQKNQAGSIKSLRYKVAHTLCVKITCVLTNQVTVRTPLLSEQPMGERECLAPDVSRFFISSLWGSIMNMWNLKKKEMKTCKGPMGTVSYSELHECMHLSKFFEPYIYDLCTAL